MPALVLPQRELSGPTVRLRPWRLWDAPALVAAWEDPEIESRLPVPELRDLDVAERWIAQRDRARANGRSVDFAVTDLLSGEVIGEVALNRLDPKRRAALVGWWIAEGWRNQGRAREAVGLVVDWVLQERLLDAVMAEISADNKASIAVARSAGLRQIKTPSQTQERGALHVFARTRSAASNPPP